MQHVFTKNFVLREKFFAGSQLQFLAHRAFAPLNFLFLRTATNQ
jgi:hypothetical protein